MVKPEGAEVEVFHDTAGAYTGDHALALWVRDAKGNRCGVRQQGIGLIEGKEYVGYVVLAHAAAPAPVEIRLSWGQRATDGQSVMLSDSANSEKEPPRAFAPSVGQVASLPHQLGAGHKRYPFRFRAGATTDAAELSVTLSSPGYVWLACLSLMPADNVEGMRADTLELIRKLAPPIMRWPGGNFVSGYHWKDAVGPRDRRPPRWEARVE